MTATIADDTRDPQDQYGPYVDKQDEAHGYPSNDSVYAGADSDGNMANPGLAHPDQGPYAEILAQVASSILAAVKADMEYYARIKNPTLMVNPNVSGEVQFNTFGVTSQSPVMLVKEKTTRGDTVITNYGPGDVSIAKHNGLMMNGTDTVLIPAGSSRTVRYRGAIWSIASTTASAMVDVQQEFD